MKARLVASLPVPCSLSYLHTACPGGAVLEFGAFEAYTYITVGGVRDEEGRDPYVEIGALEMRSNTIRTSKWYRIFQLYFN